MDEIVRKLLSGDQRALSRLVTLIERGDSRGAEVLAEVYPHTGKAYCVGVTGPPGAGKSTLVDQLAGLWRDQGRSVGILAVDPTSPFSGGAFLGDRIRMQRHYLDSGVFIRSMATRKGSGGLPRMVRGAVRLLDASGKDVVMVETAGVGQTELGIMGVADTVVVVVVPEAGDSIQTLKAGLMEIADIYVVNKADRDGANQMVIAINSMLKMGLAPTEWTPPVLATQAHKNEGVPELHSAIQRHRKHLEGTSRLERRREERRGEEFMGTVEEEIGRRLKELVATDPSLKAVFEDVKRGEREPYSSAISLLEGSSSLLGDLIEPSGR